MKISRGEFKGRTLATPKNATTRPTTHMLRQAVFNMCQHICEGARFLDLFAGSGAMGIEALSLGVETCTFVENDPQCIKCIKANLALLELNQNGTVIFGDVLATMKQLAKQGKPFDLIYADPPYHTKKDPDLPMSARVVKLIDMLAENASLLSPEGILFVEDGIKLDPAELELQFLTLKNVRTFGSAILHQFVARV